MISISDEPQFSAEDIYEIPAGLAEPLLSSIRT